MHFNKKQIKYRLLCADEIGRSITKSLSLSLEYNVTSIHYDIHI